MISTLASASSSGSLRDQIAPTDQIVRCGAKGKHPVDEASAAVPEFSKEGDRFHPAEGLLDQLALTLAEGISDVADRAVVDGAAAAAINRFCDMRRDAHLT